MVTDLANEITSCAEWDPKILRSPTQTVTPISREAATDKPFAQGLQTAVEVPVLSTSKTNGFIDDLIQVFLDTPENRERGAHCVPLAVHATSRPHASNDEPIPRRSLLGKAKRLAKGTPAEPQIVQGLEMATQSLLVSLPDNKFEAWTAELQAMITSKRTTYGAIDLMVGQLNHATFLIPLTRHFLNRLGNRIQRSQLKKTGDHAASGGNQGHDLVGQVPGDSKPGNLDELPHHTPANTRLSIRLLPLWGCRI
jgi:hypothetical protein